MGLRTRSSVSIKLVKDFLVPFPPLPEVDSEYDVDIAALALEPDRYARAAPVNSVCSGKHIEHE